MAKKIILKGKKVVLRPLSLNDASQFCKWLGDREVTKFLSRYYEQGGPSLKEEREWINKTKRDKDKLTLSIDSIDNEHIGSISLFNINSDSKHAEYGVMIGNKKYWGQGHGTEACKLICGYGFKQLKLHRIYLRYFAYNIRGEKSYKKAGFKIEGRQREHLFRAGAWHDEILMGLLKNEYLKNNKK